jgi:ankyrin repeat protein
MKNTIQKFLLFGLIASCVPAMAVPNPKQELNHKLYCATCLGNLGEVKQLIARGADVNARSASFGWTSLEYAAYHGHKEICTLLIDAGANVNTELFFEEGSEGNLIGKSIHESIYWQRLDVLPYTPLALALLQGHMEIGKLLISAGANPTSALFVLTDSDCPEDVYKLLISAQANVNYAVTWRKASTDGYGFTPLMKASFRNDAKLCQILIKAGANVNAKVREYSNHPRGLGIKRWHQAWIEANNKNYGYSALCYARDEKICQFLIDAGADLNMRGMEGETVLMDAVEYCNKNKCKILLDAGADTKIKDMYGRTALDKARDKLNQSKGPNSYEKEKIQDYKEIYQLLLAADKLPKAQDACKSGVAKTMHKKAGTSRWARLKAKVLNFFVRS